MSVNELKKKEIRLGPRDELEFVFQICEEMDWSSPLEEDLTKFDYK